MASITNILQEAHLLFNLPKPTACVTESIYLPHSQCLNGNLVAMNERTRELIRQRMQDLDIPQGVMAERLSMTPSQVSRIISGDRGTTLENLIAIADILKIDRRYFLAVAAGLPPETDKDPWVEDVSHKLKLLPPNLRGFADDIIDSILKREDAEARKTKPRPKTAKP